MANERRAARTGPRPGGTAETRRLLLEAAAEVFAEEGYAAATVDTIAQRAGVAVGSIYSRFGSKRALYEALLADVLSADEGVARGALDGGPAATTEAMSARLVEVADSRQQTLLETEGLAQAMRDPELLASLRDHDRTARALAAAMLAEEAGRLGWALRLAPDDAASVVVALFHGLVRQRRIDPASVGDDLFAQACLLLVEGLRA